MKKAPFFIVFLISIIVLTSTVYAAIPSSKSYSQTWQGRSAYAYGNITSTTASSTTRYGTSADMDAYVGLWWTRSGNTYLTATVKDGWYSSATASVEAGNGGASYSCETSHSIFVVPSAWEKYINYTGGSSGYWTVS